MVMIEGFTASGNFYDDKNFPRGFSRSGEFNIVESELIQAYGRVLSDLMHGITPPRSPQQTHFVSVMLGDIPPATILERTWLKYLSLINKKRAVSAFSSLTTLDLLVGTANIAIEPDESPGIF